MSDDVRVFREDDTVVDDKGALYHVKWWTESGMLLRRAFDQRLYDQYVKSSDFHKYRRAVENWGAV